MAAFVGRWRLESSEGFDDYMKAVGVGLMLRTTANALKPDVVFSIDGDTWKLRSESTFKNTELVFKLGEEFEEKTADGRDCKTTMTLEGDNKLVHFQKGKVDSTLTRTVDGDTLTLVLEAKGVKSTRAYKKV